MKVYLALEEWEYEYPRFLGIFTTREKAEGCRDFAMAHPLMRGGEYPILEFELDIMLEE